MIIVDAIKKSSETDQIPLKWVGMEKVTLPIVLGTTDRIALGSQNQIVGEFDVFVNLVNPSKGIHMSRLYDLLTRYTQSQPVSLTGLRNLLKDLVQSQNGLSTQSRLLLSFSLPVAVMTLKSERSYFKLVPIRLEFLMSGSDVLTGFKFQLDYSSTCPQSAALAHQLTIEEMQKQNSAAGLALTDLALSDWYKERGFIATPHAQRSQLDLEIQVSDSFDLAGFPKLFLALGECLGTPTQGLVKREDEQEFARLNAVNLMFCEDAARKLVLFFKKSTDVLSGSGKVVHLESLHSHNAVAYFEF